MNKFYISFLTLSLTFSASAVDLPVRTANDDYENINNRKEYTYDVYPDLVFWHEGGRPFWRAEQTSTSGSNKTTRNAINNTGKIHFEMEEADLGFMDKRNLRIIATNLKQNRKNIDSIVVNGFASRPGSRKYNKELSKKRASNVKEYLISNGVDPSIIEARGFGESMSLASKAKSRRVEIYIK